MFYTPAQQCAARRDNAAAHLVLQWTRASSGRRSAASSVAGRPSLSRHTTVIFRQTPTGKIYIGGFFGSAFCFHNDGYLVTCEHVRQDMHNQSCLKEGGRL